MGTPYREGEALTYLCRTAAEKGLQDMLRDMAVSRVGIPLPQVLQQRLDAVCWQALGDGPGRFTAAVTGSVLHGCDNCRHELAWMPEIQGHLCSFAVLMILQAPHRVESPS